MEKNFFKNVIGSWTISVNEKASLPPLNPAHKEPSGWSSHIKW
jgi:alpha-L-fucosidase 2